MENPRSYGLKGCVPHYTKSRPTTNLLPREKFAVLNYAAEGLLTKLHTLKRVLAFSLDGPKPTDLAWKSGIIPDAPKLCAHLAKRFPEHPRLISLEKVEFHPACKFLK